MEYFSVPEIRAISWQITAVRNTTSLWQIFIGWCTLSRVPCEGAKISNKNLEHNLNTRRLSSRKEKQKRRKTRCFLSILPVAVLAMISALDSVPSALKEQLLRASSHRTSTDSLGCCLMGHTGNYFESFFLSFLFFSSAR